jgi:hypothetical protein
MRAVPFADIVNVSARSHHSGADSTMYCFEVALADGSSGNHADGIASVDLFVVPTITFRLLYGFVVLRHRRR